MPQLTQEQINQLANNPTIKTTVEANKVKAQARGESDLMLLGYNQALLDYGQLPEGHTTQSWEEVIEGQKTKLGIA